MTISLQKFGTLLTNYSSVALTKSLQTDLHKISPIFPFFPSRREEKDRMLVTALHYFTRGFRIILQ